jgi:hypothetical protein
MSLIGGERFVESGSGEIESVGGYDAAAHESMQLPEITAILGGYHDRNDPAALGNAQPGQLAGRQLVQQAEAFCLELRCRDRNFGHHGSFQSDWSTLHDWIWVDGRARPEVSMVLPSTVGQQSGSRG